MVTKEKVIDSLYEHCKDRSATTKDIVTRMLRDFAVVPSDHTIESLIEIVRPYKQTSSKFEETVTKIYDCVNGMPYSGNYMIEQIREIALSKIPFFEFNSEERLMLYKNTLTSYLTDMKYLGDLTDFVVVCDERNNTPEMIDQGNFKADMYIRFPRQLSFTCLTIDVIRDAVEFPLDEFFHNQD